jgi:hypothetical protein
MSHQPKRSEPAWLVLSSTNDGAAEDDVTDITDVR